ncbi:ribulose 1,5-bisphosphate carboxylase large subunit [Rhodococcus sp. HNM0569]|uniref:ribulose 1,5-bisphosphate carboxylase large subunit n=1 Tax=Rhodococcus sp. HNM0569 TaxID=2716340 RepID=UPI00146C79D4|nr:ribulose 1,5-bisphosphate carboxylase large subunit [Rhodococcus sp. HNM0569]NLU84599.1 ribulose 1,5-bisphosphate carboxylase large subunit [Rhodococcus sp. HNM0569]
MAFEIPGPREVVGAAVAVARWGVGTATLVASLPARIESLVSGVERLLVEVEFVVARIDAVTDGAVAVHKRAAEVTDAAATVTETAAALSTAAQQLLEIYEPLALQAAPLAKKFVDDFSEEEVAAAIALVDQLPELTARTNAVMPILATLDTVAPEIHQLLETVKDVRQAIQGVPGFKYFRRRGESAE